MARAALILVALFGLATNILRRVERRLCIWRIETLAWVWKHELGEENRDYLEGLRGRARAKSCEH